MPNDNKLRGLWLHFDEVREVECELCLEYESAMMAGMVGANVPRDAIINAALYDPDNCPFCSGTGVKRVRVWGKVEVGFWFGKTEEDIPVIIARVRWWKDDKGSLEWYWEDGKDEGLIWDKIIPDLITAFLAKTLPGAVADHISKEDV